MYPGEVVTEVNEAARNSTQSRSGSDGSPKDTPMTVNLSWENHTVTSFIRKKNLI